MPSIEEGIASLKSLSDDKDLEDRVLSLKMLLEEGIITQDEADQRLKEFKRNRGMANGGEIKEPPPDGTPIDQIPIEILLDPRSAIFGVTDREEKIEILKKMGIIQTANSGGEIKDGIATFIPHMNQGGILNSLSQMMKALVFIESGGNPNAVSEAGAIGLTQVKVPTAMQPGNKVENIFQIARKNGIEYSGETEEEARRLLFIPNLNVQFGEQYLTAMIRRFGNVNDAVLAYNQGPTTVTNFIKAGRDPSILSQEGRDYLPKFLQAIGVEDFGFGSIPSVAEADRKPLGSMLPQSIMAAGQELLKSDDDILPVYAPEPQTRPTELVEQLGLPGDMLRDAEIEREVAMNPSLVEKAKPPLTRSFMMEEEEDSPIVTSSLPPLQRPFGIN
jgi:hypothetical protein